MKGIRNPPEKRESSQTVDDVRVFVCTTAYVSEAVAHLRLDWMNRLRVKLLMVIRDVLVTALEIP